METQFINKINSAVIEVLSMMARVQPVIGHAQFKSAEQTVEGKNVTGLINIKGKKVVAAAPDKHVVASIALTFPETVALHIARQMMQMEFKTIDNIVLDLTGEIANMVLGTAKRGMEAEGYELQLSLPSVIVGTNYLIAHPVKSAIIDQTYNIADGKFVIEIGYDES